MLLLGVNEVEYGVVAVRARMEGDLGTMPLDDFIIRIGREIDTKARD